LGLLPGNVVDVPAYGRGVQITPGGRTAQIERDEDGRLVAVCDTPVNDEIVFGLVDSGRQ
jgi:hypothetical protein